jgi:hypothetical protein
MIGLLLALQAAWADPGFEAVPPGRKAATGPSGGWEVQLHGRPLIQERLVVEAVDAQGLPRSGARAFRLAIPADTVGFEFVTLGRRLKLEPGRDYEASAWVRWEGGPPAAPAGASAVSGHPSAIVSFWARHRDGNGDFAGRDEWIFDGAWTRLAFRFRATDPAERTLVYVSLLPNQKPAATSILLDDFDVKELEGGADPEARSGNLVQDPGFESALRPPWYAANLGGKGIGIRVDGDPGARHLRMLMGPATSNYESAQVWQHLALGRGVRYEVSARLRWDNFRAGQAAPIVNFGIYHEASRTWYGPVDQVLEPTAEWRTYRFAHVPPAPGPWKLYVQVNGWGNFGAPLELSADDLSCVPAP